jgi:quercetin dioxygenase-like cupin family protein
MNKMKIVVSGGPGLIPGIRRRISTAAKIFLLLSCASSLASAGEPAQVTELMTKALADVPGKEVTMITVDYPPGSVDPVHRHNASTFVYVLEGSIVMQMEGGKKMTLHPGETFYEDPNGVHLVGQNASDTTPAKFLALLVKDQGAPIFCARHKREQRSSRFTPRAKRQPKSHKNEHHQSSSKSESRTSRP